MSAAGLVTLGVRPVIRRNYIDLLILNRLVSLSRLTFQLLFLDHLEM